MKYTKKQKSALLIAINNECVIEMMPAEGEFFARRTLESLRRRGLVMQKESRYRWELTPSGIDAAKKIQGVK